MEAFKTQATLKEAIEKYGYIADNDLVLTIYLAYHLQKGLLLEGPPGTGKTEIANVLAKVLGTKEPIRLQCYEGIDDAKAIYEWNYKKQLLYIEATKESQDWNNIQDDIYSDEFLSMRPILRGILSDNQQVLLIDEVDKAEEDLEALLLEVLSSYQVSIPEIGTLHAKNKPFVILTSNNQRDLTDATRRRCVYFYIDYPTVERELQIVYTRVPGIDSLLATQVVHFVGKLRKERLKKHPSVSETLDWAQALVKLGAKSLTSEMVHDTLNLILKKREDMETVDLDLYKHMKGLPKTSLKVERTVKEVVKEETTETLPKSEDWNF